MYRDINNLDLTQVALAHAKIITSGTSIKDNVLTLPIKQNKERKVIMLASGDTCTVLKNMLRFSGRTAGGALRRAVKVDGDGFKIKVLVFVKDTIIEGGVLSIKEDGSYINSYIPQNKVANTVAKCTTMAKVYYHYL